MSPPVRWSLAVGVGTSPTAVRRFGEPSADSACPAPLDPSLAVGVGQRGRCATAVPRVIALFAPLGRVPPISAATLPPVESLASGVGQNSRFTSIARLRPCDPSSCEGVGCSCRFSFSEALGVGHMRPSAAARFTAVERPSADSGDAPRAL